jgi:hypothetical protein
MLCYNEIVKGCLVSLLIFLIFDAVVGYLGYRWIKAKFLTRPITITSATGTTVGHEGETVKTGPNEEKTITFPNGSELRLDVNTEVKINKGSENEVSIFQTLGRTWSRVIKLLGVQSYAVETPTALATVRGTSFAVTLDDIFVDEGVVAVGNQLIQAGFSTKGKIPDEILNSPWFKKNRERLLKNPGDIRDLIKIFEQVKSGKLNLTQDQTNKLIPIAQRLQAGGGKLDASMAPDIAQALNIIYPDQFSDVPYWTGLLTRILPMLSQFQLLRLPSTE